MLQLSVGFVGGGGRGWGAVAGGGRRLGAVIIYEFFLSEFFFSPKIKTYTLNIEGYFWHLNLGIKPRAKHV